MTKTNAPIFYQQMLAYSRFNPSRANSSCFNPLKAPMTWR